MRAMVGTMDRVARSHGAVNRDSTRGQKRECGGIRKINNENEVGVANYMPPPPATPTPDNSRDFAHDRPRVQDIPIMGDSARCVDMGIPIMGVRACACVHAGAD
jgi:hypothetical protein